MLEYLYANPMRDVSWCWQRALGVLNGQQPAASRKGDKTGFKWINKAVEFKPRFDAARNDRDLTALALEFPDVFWAYNFFVGATGARDPRDARGGTPSKWVLEARLLARSDNREIGYAVNAPEAVVEAYERLFFNVREKLNHRDYILHCVIGPSMHRGLNSREYDLLWKLYGYFYGPLLIDALSGKCVNPRHCVSPDRIGQTVQGDVVGTMKLQAAIAAKTVNVAPDTQMELLHVFNKFVEIERTTDDGASGADAMLAQLDAMFQTLPFTIAGRDPANAHAKALPHPAHSFDESAIELSYEEHMRISVNQTLPNAKLLRQLRFPEPRQLDFAGGE